MIVKSRLAFLAISAIFVVGCKPNFVSLNAYYSATIPNPTQPYTMSIGSFGGSASASGGTIPGASYGTGNSEGNYIDGQPYCGNPEHFAEMEAVRQAQFGDGPVDWTGQNASTAPIDGYGY